MKVLLKLSSLFARLSRKASDLHGWLETQRLRRSVYLQESERGVIPFDAEASAVNLSKYGELRLKLLMEFIDENHLDAIVIFGMAEGREVYPLAKRLLDIKSKARIIGCDMSEHAVKKCKSYELANADFYQIDMEDKNALCRFLDTLGKYKSIGIYFSETAPYILPSKFKTFVGCLGERSNVKAIQLIEPACIDWKSNSEVGMIFSYQQGFWRHNFPKIISKYFDIKKIYFLDPKLRTNVHLNQPLWFISANKDVQ